MNGADMRLRNGRSQQAGFSTLEVIIAAAIFATVMIPLLTLEMRVTDNYLRYERAAERATLTRNALAVLREINPMVEYEGSVAVGEEVMLEWRAQPISRKRLSVGYPIGDGGHVVALYEVEARIVGPGGEGLAAFTIERLGWRHASAAERASGASGALMSGPDR